MTEMTIVFTAERRPTGKEVELVEALGADLRPKDIALKTGNSVKTIESRLFSLKRKFGCKTNSGLVALFFRHKLID